MSRENVKIVRQGVTAATQRPKPDEWLRDIEETATLDMTLMDVEGIDHDRVLYILRIHVRGKSSGVDHGEQEMASIATVRDEKIVRTASYPSREEALAAVDSAE